MLLKHRAHSGCFMGSSWDDGGFGGNDGSFYMTIVLPNLLANFSLLHLWGMKYSTLHIIMIYSTLIRKLLNKKPLFGILPSLLKSCLQNN